MGRRRLGLAAVAIVVAGGATTAGLLLTRSTSDSVERITFDQAGLVTVTATGHVYATAAGSGTQVVELAGSRVLARTDINGVPRSLTPAPDGNHLWVATPSGVQVLDTATQSVVATIPMRGGANSVAISRDGAEAFVAESASSSVDVFAAATYRLEVKVPVELPPLAVAPGPESDSAYATELGSGAKSSVVARIETNPPSTVITTAVGYQPYGLAVSPDASRVFVANRGSNVVNVIDRFPNLSNRLAPVGKQPQAIVAAPNSTRAYVADIGESALTIVNVSDTALTTSTMKVDGPQAGLALSPDGHHLYVAIPTLSRIEVLPV